MDAQSLADAVVAAGAVDAVAGVSADGREAFAAAGRSGLDPFTSVLEAGSITKTVIGLLLARLEIAGAVSGETPIGDVILGLPSDVAAITLEELVTHTSGLPRLQPNLWDEADRQNPYAHFGESHVREALHITTVGAKSYEYSNFGFGVLGGVLSELSGQPLPDLVEQQLFAPLHLKRTRLSIVGEQPSAADVGGFDADGTAKSHWDFTPWSAGCGAVRTTVQDLLAYVIAHMSADHELASAITFALRPRASTEEGFDVAYAWRCRSTLRWHPGGTGAFGGLVAFNGGRAVAVLATSAHGVWRAADDLILSFVT